MDLVDDKTYYPNEASRLAFINSIRRDEKINIFIIGCGNMGRLSIYWLSIIFPNCQIVVIDHDEKRLQFVIDNEDKLPKVKYYHQRVTQENYRDILASVKSGDLIIDACYNVDTISMYKLCNDRGAMYLNSAIETWDFQSIKDPLKYSLWYHNGTLLNEAKKINKINTNFVVVMGANPGNVSLWAKYGLLLIARKVGGIIKEGAKNTENNSENVRKCFSKIAKDLKLQTIHISEHDSQIVNKPRRRYEFCNTWAWDPASFLEEAYAPIELSWGTHEDDICGATNGAILSPTNRPSWHPYNHRVLVGKLMASNVNARSYTPATGMFNGMLIRHDENVTIGRYLSEVSILGDVIYQPSVYYVYKPTNACLTSLRESIELGGDAMDPFCGNGKDIPPRLLTNEIIEGADELGLSYFFEEPVLGHKVWWLGSLLDIDEARRAHPEWMHPYINATNMQVFGGYITGIMYAYDLHSKGIHKGIIFPEDIPLDYLRYSLAFQGKFVFGPAKWNNNKFGNQFGKPEEQTNWKFASFISNVCLS